MCEDLSKTNYEKIMDVVHEYQITCDCGTKTVFYPFEKVDKKICRGCHNYVFIDSKAKFKHRLKESMKK